MDLLSLASVSVLVLWICCRWLVLAFWSHPNIGIRRFFISDHIWPGIRIEISEDIIIIPLVGLNALTFILILF